MQANASKFQAMVIKSYPGLVRIDFNVSNEVLTSVDFVKLLGVQLEGKLNFDHHVSASCWRASLKILSRIGRFSSEYCPIKLYESFILPNLLYCSIVWHFGSKSSALKVEKVNKRALRVVLDDYVSSYSELLKTRRSSLYISRIKTIATAIYKCKNDINPAFVGDLFTSHDPNHHSATPPLPPPYSLINGEKFEQPIVNTKSFGLNAFRYEGAKIWNELPTHIKGSYDLNNFKGKIRKWSGPSCSCQDCILQATGLDA